MKVYSPADAVAASAAESAQGASTTSRKQRKLLLSLEACLLPWLAPFQHCTTQWGLVRDVRADGTTYERHGIIVELSANITTALASSTFGNGIPLQQLRQSIDLVKLTLAIEPLAVKSLLTRRSQSRAKSLSDEELHQVASRDAPFELHLHFEIEERAIGEMDRVLVAHVLEELGRQRVDESDVLRRYLVGEASASPSSLRLQQLPIPTVLVISSPPLHQYSPFWLSIAATSEALQQVQSQDMSWPMTKFHAPLVVKTILLHLPSMVLQSSVLNQASALPIADVRVIGSSMDLNFQTMECDERELQAFLNAVTRAATLTETIFISTGYSPRCEEPSKQDFRHNIGMMLRCIGRLDRKVCLCVDGLLALCQTRANRQAAIRGIVEFILPCSSAVNMLIVQEHEGLPEHDAHEIRRAGRQWHQAHPGQKLRLQSLHVVAGAKDSIRALVDTLDDIEELTCHPLLDDAVDDEDLNAMLQLPSLRSLTVSSLSISSMDVFRIRAGFMPQLRLEKLELSGLQLENSASMVAFVESLHPNSSAASPLSQTLHDLSIAEVDNNEQDQPPVRLAIKPITAAAALKEVLVANKALQSVNFRNVPVASASDVVCTTSTHLPAPAAIRHGALAKARNAAFLSGLQGEMIAAALELDSNIVRLVFEYSAPHVER